MGTEAAGAGGLCERVTVRVEESTKEAIESLAEAEGVSVATMSRRCLDAGIVALMSGDGSAAYVKEALNEMRHIRRALAKPGRAALAACSMLAAMYKDWMDAAWRSMPNGMRETPEGRRLEYWSGLSAEELFSLYMQSGGRLMGDRDLSYWASFIPAMRRPEWEGTAPEELLGIDAAEWAERAQGNDAARLRALESVGKGAEDA